MGSCSSLICRDPGFVPVYLAIMALYFVMAAVTQRVAVRMRRNPFPWLMYALLIPLVSLVHILILAKLAERRADHRESADPA